MAGRRTSKAVATDGRRAQAGIDVLVGVGVFMIAVGFVFGFVPTMIDPFADDQETPLVADRVASQIVDGMMAEAGRSTLLNETCTYAFFNDSRGDGADCAVPYDETESDLSKRLGIDSSYSVNVTIRRNVSGDPAPEVLCTDGTDVRSCSSGLDRLAIGPEPPADGTVVAARRTRFLDDKDVLVVVKLR